MLPMVFMRNATGPLAGRLYVLPKAEVYVYLKAQTIITKNYLNHDLCVTDK